MYVLPLELQVLVRLKQGDELMIRTKPAARLLSEGVHVSSSVSFMGYLLYVDEVESITVSADVEIKEDNLNHV